MNKLKKISSLTLSLIFILALIIPVIAANTDIQNLLDETAGEKGAGFNTNPTMAQTGIAYVMGLVAQTFISLIGLIFVSYTVYGGFLWLTSGGNEEKIEKAKKIITNGVIGIAVVIAAAGIYIMIRNILIVTGSDSSAWSQG